MAGRWQATLVCGAPSFLKGIFRNTLHDELKTMRLCITGAEKAPNDLFQMVNQLGHCRLLEGYGITECSPVVSVNMTGISAKGVGLPLKGVRLLIVSLDDHQPVPTGTEGLILIHGPNVFKGYLTHGISSPFIQVNGEQWYSSGDLGNLDAEGNLIISGRLKRFVKIGGEMISLAAIENALLKKAHDQGISVEEGSLLAVSAKEEAGEKTKIFVFTRYPTNLEEVNRSLKEAGFSSLVRAYKVKELHDIPMMGTGKTNYRALDEMLLDLIEDSSDNCTPAISK
jgi:long-chain-fatty-acid--[acyl-carrier-protein] ligase